MSTFLLVVIPGVSSTLECGILVLLVTHSTAPLSTTASSLIHFATVRLVKHVCWFFCLVLLFDDLQNAERLISVACVDSSSSTVLALDVLKVSVK